MTPRFGHDEYLLLAFCIILHRECWVCFVWAVLIFGSSGIGIACGLMSNKKRAFVLGATVPWLTLLAILLINETFGSYSSGGASMWPIAQLFGGTVAAPVGLVSVELTQRIRARYHSTRR
jgi:hypothetical protein